MLLHDLRDAQVEVGFLLVRPQLLLWQEVAWEGGAGVRRLTAAASRAQLLPLAGSRHQSFKLFLGLVPWGSRCVRNDDHVVRLNTELCQEGHHCSRLVVQLVLLVAEEEDPELAVGELLPGVEDVGEEEGETAVVVQPVNINRVAQRILVQENSPLRWLVKT